MLAYHELFENFGNGTSLVSPEQVLTQVSLYWLTNTSAGAVRYHYAEQRSGAEPACEALPWTLSEAAPMPAVANESLSSLM